MIKILNFKNKHFLALFGNFVIAVFSLLNMSLLYRSMSKSEIGTWFLFLSIQSVIESFRAGFLGTATIKFYAGAKNDRKETVLGSIWFIAVSISIIFIVANGIFWLFTKNIEYPQMLIIVKWVGLTFLSSLPFTVTIWILMADEDYENILKIRLVNNVSMFLIISVLIWLQKMNIENLMLLNFATNLLTSFFCFLIKKSHFQTIFKFAKSIIIEVAEFGKFNLGGYFANIIFKNADTFIISLFLGPSYVAIYSLPSKLMAIIELPLGSFLGTGMSAMAIAMNRNRKDELLEIFKKYVGLLTIAFIPLIIGCMIFADLAISILGGAKYIGSEAANIFRIMVFFTLLFPFDRFSGITLDMLHLPHLNFKKILIMSFFSIGGTFVGVLIFKNLYGIAIISPLTVISGVLFGYYSLRKNLDFTIKDILQIGLKEFKLKLDHVLKIGKSFF